MTILGSGDWKFSDTFIWPMIGEMTNPQTGQPMKKRSVITLEDNDHHRMEMFFSGPEGEFKGMEINYTRKS